MANPPASALTLLVSFGALAAQDASFNDPPPLLLVSGARDHAGGLPLPAFGLGDGGLATDAKRALAADPGDVLTPGGIRVRARAEGVKLDFPAGTEMLITPSLRMCLRGGEQTLPALGTMTLSFVDGSHLELEPDGNGRRPIRRVTLVTPTMRKGFWPPQQSVLVEASHRKNVAPVFNAYLVLGDGRCVYRAVPLGPLLGLRAVLRPRDDPRFPDSRIVVVGDILAASLRRLPGHVPPTPVQFPQAPEAAQRLADAADSLFAAGTIARTAQATGPLVLALPQEWRLRLELGVQRGRLTIGLGRADSVTPAVEWTINPVRTELHLVRPNGGQNGSPRYFLRGIDLSDDLRRLWPWGATADDHKWLEQELLRLGAHAQRDQLEVRAGSR